LYFFQQKKNHLMAQKPSERNVPGLALTPASATWERDFFFTQLADPQYGLFKTGAAEPGWAEEAAMLKLAIAHINRVKPRFVVVCGDLTNAMPNGSFQAKPGLMAAQVRGGVGLPFSVFLLLLTVLW
jgi:hypothetical protein